MRDAPPPPSLRLGSLIRSYRQYAGYSQREFARLVGVTQTSISQIESGKQMPYDSTLERIAIVLANRFNYPSHEEIYAHLIEAKYYQPPALQVDNKSIILSDLLRVYPPPIREVIFDMMLGIAQTFNKLSGWFKTGEDDTEEG